MTGRQKDLLLAAMRKLREAGGDPIDEAVLQGSIEGGLAVRPTLGDLRAALEIAEADGLAVGQTIGVTEARMWMATPKGIMTRL